MITKRLFNGKDCFNQNKRLTSEWFSCQWLIDQLGPTRRVNRNHD